MAIHCSTLQTFFSFVPSNVVVLTQDLADELVLVDTKPDKLCGKMLDSSMPLPSSFTPKFTPPSTTPLLSDPISASSLPGLARSSTHPGFGSSSLIISTLADPHCKSLTPSTTPITRLRLCWDSFHFARYEYSKK
jgi:hypothetical protein